MRGGDRWALLGTPVFAGSIALLLLNDHVLKAAWPGVVTGKLSDVAGVVMIAIALAAVTGSRGAAVATTTVAFAALKTIPMVAVWAAPVLGGVTRTDPTDLIALAALFPLWPCLHPARNRGPSESRSPLWRRVVLVGAAVIATTATSCAPGGVWSVGTIDGVVVADVNGDVWNSDDGGASWQRAEEGSLGVPYGVDDACAAGRCFEIDRSDEPAVVELINGEPTPILVWDDAASAALGGEIVWSCEDGALADVTAVEVDGEVSVIVSMTEAGTLRWSASDRTWTWVGIGGWGLEADRVAGHEVARPAVGPTLFESTLPGRALMVATVLGALVSAPFVGRLARSRRREPAGYVAAVVAIGVVSAAPMLFLVALADDWRNGDGRALLVVASVAAVLVAAAIAIVAAFATRPHRPLAPPDERARLG